jgi:hypothetical protein
VGSPIRASGNGDRQRHQGGLWDVVRDVEQIAKESLLGDVDARKSRDLVEHDHEADASLEAYQDGTRSDACFCEDGNGANNALSGCGREALAFVPVEGTHRNDE